MILSQETLTMVNDIGSQLTQYKGKKFNTLDEVVRYCVSDTFKNMHTKKLQDEEFLDLTLNYITVLYCDSYLPDYTDNTYENAKMYSLVRKFIENLRTIHYDFEETYREFNSEEVAEVGLLVNENQPITLGDLIRFKHRLLPEIFLKSIGVKEEEYCNLSNNMLVNLIIEKLKDERFSNRAKKLFSIDL
ncbi:hypothetical protein [Priestia aryabhattai]|uniref:hypothetical protein n=1 Tax=Priestia aryabhattai TaxID=412384 RepID=UPI002E20F231|nr:hypothetical protein [Priestia aryabhattai]